MSSATRRYLPDALVAQRYNVHATTIFRWDRSDGLGFPKPIRINGRKYRDVDSLEAWDQQRAGGQPAPTPARGRR
jgi:hypothetical protein